MDSTPKTNAVSLVLPNFSLGGAERQAVALATALPLHGWSPLIFAAEPHGPLREVVMDAGLPIIDLHTQFQLSKKSPAFWSHLRRTISTIRKESARHGATVLQSFLFWQNQLVIPAGLRHPTVRTVITGRRNTGEYKDARPFYQRIENLTNPYSRYIVCNSERVREDCLRREKLSPDQLRVIPNGISVDRFSSGEKWALEERYEELAGGEFLIGTVGNMKRQKRHDRFLEVIAEVKQHYPGIRGIIVGRDLGEEDQLRLRRRELGLRDTVAIVGGVEDVAPILKGLDIFLMTSDFEGMPNAVMEAMASGLPVVSTPAGGVAEIINQRTLGIVTEDYEAASLSREVRTLLNQPERRFTMGEAAQRHMQDHYSIEAMVSAYCNLYTGQG